MLHAQCTCQCMCGAYGRALSTKGTPSHRGLCTCSTAAAKVSVQLSCSGQGGRGREGVRG
eukprot:scaffold17021_cov64-Phaeocystis_antarctica.AAC.5